MKKTMAILAAVALASGVQAASITQTSTNSLQTELVARTKFYSLVWNNLKDVCNTDIPALIAESNARGNTQTSMTMVVSGNLTVGTNATVSGNLVGGDVIAADDLVVSNDASVAGNATVTSNLTVSVNVLGSDVYASDDVIASNDLTVAGNATITSNAQAAVGIFTTKASTPTFTANTITGTNTVTGGSFYTAGGGTSVTWSLSTIYTDTTSVYWVQGNQIRCLNVSPSTGAAVTVNGDLIVTTNVYAPVVIGTTSANAPAWTGNTATFTNQVSVGSLTANGITNTTMTCSGNATVAGKGVVVGGSATIPMIQYGKITSTNGTGSVVFAASYANGYVPSPVFTAGSALTNAYLTAVASNYFNFSYVTATNDGTLYWMVVGDKP